MRSKKRAVSDRAQLLHMIDRRIPRHVDGYHVFPVDVVVSRAYIESGEQSEPHVRPHPLCNGECTVHGDWHVMLNLEKAQYE